MQSWSEAKGSSAGMCSSRKRAADEDEDDDGITLGGSKQPLLLAQTGKMVTRVPGTGVVFADTVTEAPPVFTHMLHNLQAVYETVILLTVR